MHIWLLLFEFYFWSVQMAMASIWIEAALRSAHYMIWISTQHYTASLIGLFILDEFQIWTYTHIWIMTNFWRA